MPPRPTRIPINSAQKRRFIPKGTFFSNGTKCSSDPGGGEGLDGLADRFGQGRMVGLETDLGLLQHVEEALRLVFLGVLLFPGAGEAVLDDAAEAGQLFPVLAVLRPPDGVREFVQQMAQMVVHDRERYRRSGLYLMRCGSRASAPRRFLRS